MIFAGIVLGAALAMPAPRQNLRWRRQPVPVAETIEGGRGIVVGGQRLYPCRIAVAGYCGRLRVPLNWLDPGEGPTLSIRFQWLPATGGPSTRTIVAEEGGPGYSTTGTGFEYRTLFAPLLRDRNLLMMDQRGTGGSEAILCPALQPWGGTGGTVPFGQAVAYCGAQLDRTYRSPRGGYVHAADLFGTSQAVRDLAAILAALGQGPVDYYGDSYGSFFGQVFAARYPQLLRAVVLDSTYPTIHQDPFDRPGQEEIRFGFDAVCERSLACSAAAPGLSTRRIARLARALDAKPLVTTALMPDGRRQYVRMRAGDIWTMLISAGDDYGPYRNLNAAARAYLERGDAVPLARLYAWTSYGPAFSPSPVHEYSEGLAIADSCTVYTNPFDMTAPIAQRRIQFGNAVAALPATFGYPLTNRDVMTSPSEWYDECVTWPAPVHSDPIITKNPPLVPRNLPVLILSGDLDETTAPGDNRQAAAALGPSVRFVDLPNEIHAPALLDPYHCASAIVQEFVRHPSSVDTSCTVRIPEVRTVGTFPWTIADQVAASPAPGNGATANDLRLAAIGVEAIGDAIQGAGYAYYGYRPNCGAGYCGPGLRGGRFEAGAGIHRVSLAKMQYSSDTVTSGTAYVGGAFLPGDPGLVNARGVVVAMANGASAVTIDVQYDQRVPHAIARIAGRASSGARIAATLPAP